MVIAPPSVKPGKGIYRWHRITTIADAPDWLIELVKYWEPEITEKDLTTSHWTTTQDFERLKRALESISANCSYEIWFEVLCALKTHLAMPLVAWLRSGQWVAQNTIPEILMRSGRAFAAAATILGLELFVITQRRIVNVYWD
jgi:hypothetical protein